MRRVPLTNILVCRPLNRRPQKSTLSNNLAEFLESDDNELNDTQRPYITGHNRYEFFHKNMYYFYFCDISIWKTTFLF